MKTYVIGKFTEIELDSWHRKDIFNHFIQVSPSVFSMVVNIDVTKLIDFIKKARLKFNPVMIWLVSKIINQHEEFLYSILPPSQLGLFSIVHPLYTEMGPKTKNIKYLWTEYDPDFKIFYDRCINDKEVNKESENWQPQGKIPLNVFSVSCIPWVSFSSFHLENYEAKHYLTPQVTYGKYFEANGKTYLPMQMQAHHANCDGYHVARFFTELEDLGKTFQGE